MKATDTGLFDGATIEFTAADLEAFTVLKLALANFPLANDEWAATAARLLDAIDNTERVNRYGKPQEP